MLQSGELDWRVVVTSPVPSSVALMPGAMAISLLLKLAMLLALPLAIVMIWGWLGGTWAAAMSGNTGAVGASGVLVGFGACAAWIKAALNPEPPVTWKGFHNPLGMLVCPLPLLPQPLTWALSAMARMCMSPAPIC